MRHSRNNYLLMVLILIGVTLAGCRSKQRVVSSTTPVADKSERELFSDILSKGFTYNTLSARLNMSLTSGTRSMSSRANIRIVKDNALQISVQPLFGVEMFRLYVNPDSVVVLDRMNKRYVKESIDSLKERYPIGFDFYTLQAIFTNAVFVSGKSEPEPRDYRKFAYIRTSDLNYYLTTKDPESGIEYSFTVNGDDRVTFTHLMQSEGKNSLQWSYGNFMMLDQGAFPHRMNASFATSDQRINTELVFSDVAINQPLVLTLQIPESYTRSSVDEVLKIIAPSQ